MVGGNAGTEERRGFGGVEGIGHLREGFDGSDHVFGVAAVKIETGDFLLRAVGKIAAAAVEASVVLAAVPADADALALLPGSDAGAELGDDAGNFMAGRKGIA